MYENTKASLHKKGENEMAMRTRRGVVQDRVKLDAQELRMFEALKPKLLEMVSNEVARIMQTPGSVEKRLAAIEEWLMPDE